MKAILYTRVSTARQAKEGESLENQALRLKQYAEFKGFTDTELITDEGLSGKRTDRPGFIQVMGRVARGEVNAVIVYSLSRFARNTRATLEAVETMRIHDVAFHSLTEMIDTTTSMGRFFVTVMAALAQLEAEQITERVASVIQHKRRKGECVGQVPFGKRVNGKKLEDDKSEQATIRLIEDLCSKQYLSYSAIAKVLEQQRVPNKSGRAKWSKTMVHRILKQRLQSKAQAA